VKKTSVYLPDSLKKRLSALAGETHSSEAELIREAIEERLAREANSQPAARDSVDPPVAGRLVGIGVGPGPSGMITVEALTALRRADRIVAPCTSAAAIGRAEAIVRQAAPDVVVERMVFVMEPDPAARAGALGVVCDAITKYLAAGDEVGFITLGDPNTYSTVSSVVTGVLARRPTTPVVTVAGIMAFQALASKAGVVLTDEQQSMVLLSAASEPEVVKRELADPNRTVMFYKGGGRIETVADYLEQAGRLDQAVIGELIGMDGERVAPLAQVRDQPASYLSAVIAPAEGIS